MRHWDVKGSQQQRAVLACKKERLNEPSNIVLAMMYCREIDNLVQLLGRRTTT
jgi:hypothetical protein